MFTVSEWVLNVDVSSEALKQVKGVGEPAQRS